MSDEQTPYEQIGGQAGVVRLVAAFYARMDTLPAAAAIRALHQDDLTSDRHKLAAFLSGWLGGPPLYWEAWGAPVIRERHRHLPIDADARRAWMLCMDGALDEAVADPGLRRNLSRRFAAIAAHVQNVGRDPEPSAGGG
jgi:hemoglobin